MPFTLSHPAAVLPLARTKLVFSALVAGALAPDIGYFLTFSSEHAESHSLKGLFWFCLPAGFLLLLLFQKVLKRPMLALLPASHQARLYPYAQGFRFGPASRFGLILLSLLIGSATHLLWDSFTHDTGWVVRHLPALTMPIHLTHHHSMPAYKLLQHGSSILGLVVLGVAYFIWLRGAEPSHVNLPRLSSGAKVIIAALMHAGACAAALLRIAPRMMSWDTIRWNVVQGGITFVSVFVLEAIVFSLIWRLTQPGSERA
jgi:Domain of unknown function (DUF4184)